MLFLILHIRMLICGYIVENDEFTCASHRSVDDKILYVKDSKYRKIVYVKLYEHNNSAIG